MGLGILRNLGSVLGSKNVKVKKRSVLTAVASVCDGVLRCCGNVCQGLERFSIIIDFRIR